MKRFDPNYYSSGERSQSKRTRERRRESSSPEEYERRRPPGQPPPNYNPYAQQAEEDDDDDGSVYVRRGDDESNPKPHERVSHPPPQSSYSSGYYHHQDPYESQYYRHPPQYSHNYPPPHHRGRGRGQYYQEQYQQSYSHYRDPVPRSSSSRSTAYYDDADEDKYQRSQKPTSSTKTLPHSDSTPSSSMVPISSSPPPPSSVTPPQSQSPGLSTADSSSSRRTSTREIPIPEIKGRRGTQRPKRTTVERLDIVQSRPNAYPETNTTGKKGTSGRPVELIANFFALKKRTDWCIFQYSVFFRPTEEQTNVKKSLFKVHAEEIGSYIFDGTSLYTSHRLNKNNEPIYLFSMRETDNEKIQMTVRFIQELAPGDVMYIHFFNITLRKCLAAMKLEELGRHFFDRQMAIKMPQMKVELWPGYITSIRNYERNVLLCVELTHKVLRQDTVLDVIRTQRNNGASNQQLKDHLVGTIIMTHYNRKTYRIDDIDWNSSPSSTFEQGKEKKEISYAEYYKTRYKLNIQEKDQPMLISRPKKKDIHRGMTGPIVLVPEFCQMTGLSEQMRTNFQMMRELAQHLNKGPSSRLTAIELFMRRLQESPEVQKDLQLWGLEFSSHPVKVLGRVIPGEPILFGGSMEEPSADGDWARAFRSRRLLQARTGLHNWVVIVPQRDSGGIENLIRVMQIVSKPLNFRIQNPVEVTRLPNVHIASYVKAIDQAVANFGKRGLQLLFVILPQQKLETYAAVKRRCVVDYGLLSQCYLSRNVQAKNLMAIATKCVIQMSAKLGGEPWQVQNPMKTCMIIGFDVFHDGKRKNPSIGAMVASTSETLAKYYSTVSFHKNKEELSSNLCQDITKCIRAYKSINNSLPDRVIMYRDGVGEGQLCFVYNTELVQIKNALNVIYTSERQKLPKFSFIVCTKKLHTRIFSAQRGRESANNPSPGTVVDDVITLPERWDFYLVSQNVKQGTVSPTSYNVLHDEQGLSPDKMQRLTFKLCHMYFNWSGTVAVPACAQYAHKLAYLTGVALNTHPSERLSHLLYYL